MTRPSIAKLAAGSPLSDRQSRLIKSSQRLSRQVATMSFDMPVSHVYNPLKYAWKPHREYLLRCRVDTTRTLFLGMNPGPWGMAQTGVPFGQVEAVRGWLGINEPVDRPENEHPRRPIEGFACRRSEVSGERLWGLFKSRFGTSDAFFNEHFVANYCPLVFMEASGKNRTPDKLAASEIKTLQSSCDQHLLTLINLLSPQFLVGVGAYAEACLLRVVKSMENSTRQAMSVLRILHPSPASPAANRNWAGIATSQLIDGGVWKP